MADKRTTSAQSGKAVSQRITAKRRRSSDSARKEKTDRPGARKPSEPAKTDVTGRGQVAEEFRDLGARYRDLFESANDVILMVDSSGDILDINRQGEKLSGFAREELIHSNVFRDLIVPEDREATAAVLQNLTEGKSQVYELRWRAKDGTIVTFEGSSSSRFSSDGAFISTRCILHDIRGRVQAEKALQQTNEELETRVAQRTAELARSNADLQQFAFSASHDLQEPLRMMSSYLQALQQQAGGSLDEQAQNLIRLSLDSAKRMQQLINDLLAYAHVGTRQENFDRVGCNAVVDQVIADLGETIRRDRAEVSREGLPTVVADATLLAELFQNLIGNGIKFHGPHPPRVHISAEESDREWVFSVRDNGIGIDPKYSTQIFTVFQRLHPSDKYPGTGIGLAICKRVVQRHKGRIWCDSEPGQGTTFHFSIPKQRGDRP